MCLANHGAPAFSLHVSIATSASKHATPRPLAHLHGGLFTQVRGRCILGSWKVVTRCASGNAPSLPSTPQPSLGLSPAVVRACAMSGSQARTLWRPAEPHLARPPYPSPPPRHCSTSASSSGRRDG